MKLTKIEHIESFLAAVNSCKGKVWLTSQYEDKYNLKSKLSQYIAIAALLGNNGDELELWTEYKEDEQLLLKYLNENPEVR